MALPSVDGSSVDCLQGALCSRKSSLTQTLTSRLCRLWQHVEESRTNFEANSDTGKNGHNSIY